MYYKTWCQNSNLIVEYLFIFFLFTSGHSWYDSQNPLWPKTHLFRRLQCNKTRKSPEKTLFTAWREADCRCQYLPGTKCCNKHHSQRDCILKITSAANTPIPLDVGSVLFPAPPAGVWSRQRLRRFHSIFSFSVNSNLPECNLFYNKHVGLQNKTASRSSVYDQSKD